MCVCVRACVYMHEMYVCLLTGLWSVWSSSSSSSDELSLISSSCVSRVPAVVTERRWLALQVWMLGWRRNTADALLVNMGRWWVKIRVLVVLVFTLVTCATWLCGEVSHHPSHLFF